MTEAGDGQPATYRVSMSEHTAQALSVLAAEAEQGGIEDQFRAALQTVQNRLRNKPLEFGELIRHLSHMRLLMHVGFVPPLRVWFGVHEDLPIVFIQKFALVLP